MIPLAKKIFPDIVGMFQLRHVNDKSGAAFHCYWADTRLVNIGDFEDGFRAVLSRWLLITQWVQCGHKRTNLE